jgi:teichoic acid transport system permease protein
MQSSGANALQPLRDPARRRSTVEDLRRVWALRHFLWYSAVSELRARQMLTFLGNLWHLLNPALHIFVYYVVFGVIIGTDRGVDNFLPFLAIGVFSFDHMRRVVIGGSSSLISNRGLIQSISLPKTVLPLSLATAEIVSFAFPAIVMIVVALITGERPMLSWVLLAPIYVLQILFVTGLAFIGARITFYVKDFENILRILFRFAFYMSGVLFLVDRFVSSDSMRRVIDLNPFYDYVTLYRWAIMGMPISKLAVLSACVWPVVSIVVGYWWFRGREQDYGRE